MKQGVAFIAVERGSKVNQQPTPPLGILDPGEDEMLPGELQPGGDRVPPGGAEF